MKSLFLPLIASLCVVNIALADSLQESRLVIHSSNTSIAPSSIDQVIRLVDKEQAGSSQKKLSIVVEDNGMSTDVSPRYTVYLGYANLSEMGSVTADFKINGNAIKFISAIRKAAGIYEVKVQEYREDGMYEVIQEIDTTQMFSDEQKAIKTCGGDFCYRALETSVSVKETAKKLK
ncbi:MAG: hypothetical protein ACXVB1_06060 [Pseudobdellovibrionaceae bacterium]